MIGVDRAIESLRNEADGRLHEEQQPAHPQNPGTTQLNPDDAVRQPATTSFSLMEQAIFAAGRAFEAGDDRLGAVDKAIGSWGQDEPASTPSIFPVLPDSTITRAPAATAEDGHRQRRGSALPGRRCRRGSPQRPRNLARGNAGGDLGDRHDGTSNALEAIDDYLPDGAIGLL